MDEGVIARLPVGRQPVAQLRRRRPRVLSGRLGDEGTVAERPLASISSREARHPVTSVRFIWMAIALVWITVTSSSARSLSEEGKKRKDGVLLAEFPSCCSCLSVLPLHHGATCGLGRSGSSQC